VTEVRSSIFTQLFAAFIEVEALTFCQKMLCSALSNEIGRKSEQLRKWQWKCASSLWLFNVFLLKFIEKLWTVTFE